MVARVRFLITRAITVERAKIASFVRSRIESGEKSRHSANWTADKGRVNFDRRKIAANWQKGQKSARGAGGAVEYRAATVCEILHQLKRRAEGP
jgi:hypothetical protein